MSDILAQLNLKESGIPIAFIVGGLIVGIIFEKIILAYLDRLSRRTNWIGDDFLVKPFRGVTVFAFLILGMYFAFGSLRLGPPLTGTINQTLLVLAILLTTLLFSRIAVSGIDFYARRSRKVNHATSIFNNVARLGIFSVGVLIVLNTLGIAITPLLTALGVGGLAIALGVQNTLENLFAGLQLIMSKQVRQGDYIKLDNGAEGTVIDITWRNTSIRDPFNNMIVVPNSIVASAMVTNYNLPGADVSLTMVIGVSYEADLDHVEKVTHEVAREVMKEAPGAVPEFNPLVYFSAFGEYALEMKINLRATHFADQYIVKHEFIKRLNARFKKEKIEPPYPVREIIQR